MIIGYINGQSLELHHSKVVEKSVDYLTADFQFMTNEWKGFRKWVHFSKGDIHYQIELKNDKILKTDHLNISSGEWDVYIHGSLEREIITTNKAKLVVEVTGDLEGQYPEETPIPPYDYILNQIGSLEGLETEAKENLVSAINEIFQTVNDDNRVGIVEIKQTISSSESGGLNEITVSLTDGTVRTFTYRNGQKGEKGDKGDKGDKGENGKDYVLTDSDKEEIAEKVTLNNDVGNAVNATANGEVIRVDDVSPIEHKVKAKVSGDGINSQDVILYRCGKNLFDVEIHKTFPANCQVIDSTGNKYIVQGNEGKGTPLVYSTGAFQVQFKKYIDVIDKVTVSVYVTLLEIGKYNNYIRVIERNTSGATENRNDFELEINKRQKISVTYDATRGSIDAVSFYLNNNKVLVEVDTLQVEVGDVATSYEPYTEESCNFSADGTAEVLSVSPTMTLFTDTYGANIEIEYNQDINTVLDDVKEDIRELDRLISELPNGGNGGNGGTGGDNIDLSDYAKKDEIPTKVSELENDSGFITLEDIPEGDNVDFSDYAKRDELPKIDIEKIVERKVGTLNVLGSVTEEGWVKGRTISDEGNFIADPSYYLTPHITVWGGEWYEFPITFNTPFNLYDSDGNYIKTTRLDNKALETTKDTATIRFSLPKSMYSATDLKTFVEEFNRSFKIVLMDKYKIRDDVELHGIPTKTSDLENDSEFITLEDLPEGGGDYVLTEEDKAEIAEQAAALIDTGLLSAIGSGVLE